MSNHEHNLDVLRSWVLHIIFFPSTQLIFFFPYSFPTFRIVIPGGQSRTIDGDVGSRELLWKVPLPPGTAFIIVAGDLRGEGTGQSTSGLNRVYMVESAGTTFDSRCQSASSSISSSHSSTTGSYTTGG